MKTTALFFALGLGICAGACTKSARVVAPRPAATATTTSSSKPASVEPRAPRRVTLVREDLEDAARAIDARDSYAQRIARIRAVLGVEGEPIAGGTAFRAIGPKSATGPVDCIELAVLEGATTPTFLPADRPLCGLPYANDASRPYAGPGPRFTVKRIRRVLEELTHLPSAEADTLIRTRLGPPDDTPAALMGAQAWFAVGPASHDTPVTCHVLVVPPAAPARIDERPLSDCDIGWPAPAKAFAHDDTVRVPQSSAPNDECIGRCAAAELCVVMRTAEARSTVSQRGDEMLAFRYDGRPATVETSTTCRPFPSPPQLLATECGSGTDDVVVTSSFRKPASTSILLCTMRRPASP